MTQTEALRLALEALEGNRRTHHYCEDTWYSCPKHEDGCANDSESDECNCGADKANAGIDQAIIAIKAALEAKDEPVGWAEHGVINWLADKQFNHTSFLYATPPPRTWVGLTDEEMEAAIPFGNLSGEYSYDDILNIILLIQAKLRSKND